MVSSHRVGSPFNQEIGLMKKIMFHKTVRRKTLRERAQGMVEFALVLPLLLLLIFGVIELGRMFVIYSSVNSASREAARYGAASGLSGNNVIYYNDCAGMLA